MPPRPFSRRKLLGWAVGGAALSGLTRLRSDEAAAERPRIGLTGPVGLRGPSKPSPAGRSRWEIAEGGLYENYEIDMGFAEEDAVRIRADGTTLRHCELRNGRKDAIEVYANDVLIESCRITHFLAGTYAEQADAHGVTGRSDRLTVRNCEISYCSGDGWQMDPGRGPWSEVLIEHCDVWTGPLPAEAGGFREGERPGENGVDTKQSPANARSKLTIRNSVFHGYAEPGYIGMPAALNLKDHVEVLVENCLFYDNFVSLRLRGPGARGGAHVTVRDCSFYDCDTAIRMEDRIEKLEIINPRFGAGVRRRYQQVGGRPPGLKIEGERDAPPLDDVLGKRSE